MVYKVLLVEDEHIIREGLETFIDWEGLGFEIVASLSDGKEAIEFLAGNHVHIILTDIEMKFVSGLAVAQYVHENNIPTKVVLLTAHSRFDYLAEGMKFKVEDYILKAASMEEIEEKFRGIYAHLEEERFEKERQSRLDNWLMRVVPYLKEQFLKNLLAGAYEDDEEIVQNIRRSGVDVNVYNTKAFLYELKFEDDLGADSWRYGNDGYRSAIHNFFDGFAEKIFFYLIEDKTYILQLTDNEIISDVQSEFYNLFETKIQLLSIGVYDNVFMLNKRRAEEVSAVEPAHSFHYIIDSALKYIDEHVGDDITLNSVSKAVYVSPEYLSRLFKKYVGMNFKDYVIKCKMAKAMVLLKDPQYKIYEISELLGYKSVQFFSKVFKNYTDVTPTEYRGCGQ